MSMMSDMEGGRHFNMTGLVHVFYVDLNALTTPHWNNQAPLEQPF